MSDNNDHFEKICEFCGAECWLDEMKTHEKCWTCYVQDCNHLHKYQEFYKIHKTHVEIYEYCTTCESERSILFYFDLELKPKVSFWQNENVSEDDMLAYQESWK